ncbi:Chromatin-remodeling complexes subunit NGG1 [Golovinomyces cichoracearum]|uniref:Chromatin-remodeling complexes subunit NGG1 n=1 Tax=Golovinomyces cichoracearum TaxID=62708 RepID=A0A420H9A9_9PEZI|nr:Chromatin-remodeling complexes subunit NGG1 [Golovinomyces cichoracearum]
MNYHGQRENNKFVLKFLSKFSSINYLILRMPPLPSQKGTVKKARDIRYSRSRNTTPTVVGSLSGVDGFTPYLELPLQPFRTIEDFSNRYGNGIPTSKELDALLDRLKHLVQIVEARGSACDKGMRLLAQTRKDRLGEIETERREEESVDRLKRIATEEEGDERGRNKLSKFKRSSNVREKKPGTYGSHILTVSNGTNTHVSSPIKDKKIPRKSSLDRGSPSSSLSPPALSTPIAPDVQIKHDDKGEKESSSDEHQPSSLALTTTNCQTFGQDPSVFPDPTVYEIQEVKEGMTREQLKEIYSVAYFPENNLDDLIPGSPPDKDFSNVKPANQVQANTFATYIEPYFRPFEDQDIAFLRERGDRITPFVTSRRGKRHYSEIWAEEDGTLTTDVSEGSRERTSLNQPRGSMDLMNDENAESDVISVGPILSRLLSTLRPEHRAPAAETINGTPNGNSHNEVYSDVNENIGASTEFNNYIPATQMPESNTEAWKKASHPTLDYAQIDERIKLELRHIGFLPLDDEPDYDAHNDDDVAIRLRYLQAKLKQTAIINGARKARLQELVKEKMAHQEFTTILEDLDSQVQAAYLKRTRTLGKNKKSKRPGGSSNNCQIVSGTNGSGMARPGIGDMTKTLMERRRKWIDTIGSVLDPEATKVRRVKDPESSIFKQDVMIDFIRKEEAAWEDGDDEY